MTAEGAIAAMTPFHNTNCPHGFILGSYQAGGASGEVRFCQVPAGLHMHTPWLSTRVHIGVTPRHIAWCAEPKVLALAVAKTVAPRPRLPAEEGGDPTAAAVYACSGAAVQQSGEFVFVFEFGGFKKGRGLKVYWREGTYAPCNSIHGRFCYSALGYSDLPRHAESNTRSLTRARTLAMHCRLGGGAGAGAAGQQGLAAAVARGAAARAPLPSHPRGAPEEQRHRGVSIPAGGGHGCPPGRGLPLPGYPAAVPVGKRGDCAAGGAGGGKVGRQAGGVAGVWRARHVHQRDEGRLPVDR